MSDKYAPRNSEGKHRILDDEGEDGEGEVVALANRSLELLGKLPEPPRQTLVEG